MMRREAGGAGGGEADTDVFDPFSSGLLVAGTASSDPASRSMTLPATAARGFWGSLVMSPRRPPQRSHAQRGPYSS